LDDAGLVYQPVTVTMIVRSGSCRQTLIEKGMRRLNQGAIEMNDLTAKRNEFKRAEMQPITRASTARYVAARAALDGATLKALSDVQATQSKEALIDSLHVALDRLINAVFCISRGQRDYEEQDGATNQAVDALRRSTAHHEDRQ
jgi:hypothetical protein